MFMSAGRSRITAWRSHSETGDQSSVLVFCDFAKIGSNQQISLAAQKKGVALVRLPLNSDMAVGWQILACVSRVSLQDGVHTSLYANMPNHNGQIRMPTPGYARTQEPRLGSQIFGTTP
jgi:hypothetical protein